jgi:hypothetical protein
MGLYLSQSNAHKIILRNNKLVKDPPILPHIMGDQELPNRRRSICWKGFNIQSLQHILGFTID